MDSTTIGIVGIDGTVMTIVTTDMTVTGIVIGITGSDTRIDFRSATHAVVNITVSIRVMDTPMANGSTSIGAGIPINTVATTVIAIVPITES